LLDNFVGIVRDFALYEKKLSLPFSTPAFKGDYSSMKSPNLLIYFNFDYDNYEKIKFKAAVGEGES